MYSVTWNAHRLRLAKRDINRHHRSAALQFPGRPSRVCYVKRTSAHGFFGCTCTHRTTIDCRLVQRHRRSDQARASRRAVRRSRPVNEWGTRGLGKPSWGFTIVRGWMQDSGMLRMLRLSEGKPIGQWLPALVYVLDSIPGHGDIFITGAADTYSPALSCLPSVRSGASRTPQFLWG